MNIIPEEPRTTRSAVSVIIRNIHDEVLVLWRRKKWDDDGTPIILPGGGVEEGELPEHAAMREVFEETGIVIHESDIHELMKFPTKWTGTLHVFVTYVNCILDDIPHRIGVTYVSIDQQKFSGYIWLPQQYADKLSNMMMPGLRKLLTDGHLYSRAFV